MLYSNNTDQTTGLIMSIITKKTFIKYVSERTGAG